jgi:hypothetical protein
VLLVASCGYQELSRLTGPDAAGDIWRNLVAQLDTIKVVEYDRGEARIQQTSELRNDVEALLVKLGVLLSPRLHRVEPIPA